MKLTVILTDRQRRVFEAENLPELVAAVAALESMEGNALFFQGRQLDEERSFEEQNVPATGAIVRVDTEETPTRRQPKIMETEVAEDIPADEDLEISAMLGFKNFGSSKGQAHANFSGAKISKKIKHRQYLNRKGGQDKPLDT
jgi:hypothetical protein